MAFKAHSEYEQELYDKGVKKADLKDGAYYEGQCRNATVARWSAKLGCFLHNRSKWGSTFTETIKHPDDDLGYDVFFPAKEITPTKDQLVPKCPHFEPEET